MWRPLALTARGDARQGDDHRSVLTSDDAKNGANVTTFVEAMSAYHERHISTP